MPAGRLVHQQQPRRVGERHRELEALQVAVGELADGRSACALMPTRASSASRLGDCGAVATPQSRASRRACDSRTVCTFSRTRHRREGRGDLEGAADAQPPDLRAAARPAMSRPSRRIVPVSGRIWPFSMLKQVLLPAPFGPISASISPAASAEETSAHGLDAAIGLGEAADLEERAHAAPFQAARDRRAARPARRNAPATPSGRRARGAMMTRPSTSLE